VRRASDAARLSGAEVSSATRAGVVGDVRGGRRRAGGREGANDKQRQGEMGARQTRRRIAVAFVVVCAIGARAAAGQMTPSSGDTYANSEYYKRDVGVEKVDLQGGRFCFAESARHERPNVPEIFLPSKIPLEVRR